jgi:hypothetical protein
MKVSTEIDNNFGYEKITQLVDNIPLKCKVNWISEFYTLKKGLLREWVKIKRQSYME